MMTEPSSTPTHNCDHKTSIWNSWAFGLVLCIANAFLSALYFSFSKTLMTSPNAYHPLWLATLRQIATMLLSLPQVAAMNAPYFKFPWKTWFHIILRSLLGFGAVVGAQLSIQRISVTDFATILAISPFVTSIAAWPILGETLKFTDLPPILACFLGRSNQEP